MDQPLPRGQHSGPDLNLETTVTYLAALIGLTVLSIFLVAGFPYLPNRFQAKLQASVLYLHFKARILYAPLSGHRRSREISFASGNLNLGTPPSRAQTLVLAFLLAANILVICYKQSLVRDSYGLVSQYKLRLGAIATCNLIPVVLTSSVHNPLIDLLKVPYNTFNTVHRWLARIVVLEVLAHLLCHVIHLTKEQGSVGLRKSVQATFITYGVIAAALFFYIALQSIKPLRSLAYEIFHYCHIILVILALIFVWLHVESQILKWYVLTAAILWAALRLWGFLVTAHRSFGPLPAIALLEYMPGDAIRIVIHAARHWKFLPGQHIYLSTPGLKIVGSHPFSVIWAEKLNDGGRKRSCYTISNKTEHELQDMSDERRSNDNQVGVAHQVFYCIVKGKSGYTKTLLEHAKQGAEAGKAEICLKALVSGPHRGRQSLAAYTTVLLFAGGVGITHQLPYIKTLFRPRFSDTPMPLKVHLVWAVPGVAVLKWIKPWLEEIQHIKRESTSSLKLDLYVTRPFHSADTPSTSPFDLFEGRPCIKSIIEHVVTTRPLGPMCISTCASGSFSDDVRQEARKMLVQGIELDLLEESYGW